MRTEHMRELVRDRRFEVRDRIGRQHEVTESAGDEQAARMSELPFFRIEDRHVLEKYVVIVEKNRCVLWRAPDVRDSGKLLRDSLDRPLHRRNEEVSLARWTAGH